MLLLLVGESRRRRLRGAAGWEAVAARAAAAAAGMGEQLSTESVPPEPAAAEPPLPAAGAPQPPSPPVQSGRAPRPQPEEDAAGAPPPPPAEPQGRETEDGVGAPLEEGPGSGEESSNSRRLSLRPVCCTVYCVESDWRPEPPPPPPESPLPPDGEGGEPRSPAAPPPSLPGGGKGGGGSIEVDLFLLPEPFSGLISGDFGSLLVLTCRVCLEEKPLKPLPCCKKPVCEDCLKRYLSSQVSTILSSILSPPLACCGFPKLGGEDALCLVTRRALFLWVGSSPPPAGKGLQRWRPLALLAWF